MTSGDVVREVQDYYDECRFDYSLVWRTLRHRGMHYGYHDEDHRGLESAIRNLDRVMADAASIGEGDRVLDAGCGAGGSALWLAENRDADVVGINISEWQVEEAREGAREKDLDARFELMDYTDTEFEDESFDVVWACESVCHTNDKSGFVREADRLLRPGGRLVVSDGWIGGELSEEEGECVDKVVRGMASRNLDSPGEFRRKLEQHDFKDIDYVDQTPNVMPSSRRLWVASLLSYPGAKLLELVGVRSETEMRNLSAAYHQYHAFGNRWLVHGMFTARKTV